MENEFNVDLMVKKLASIMKAKNINSKRLSQLSGYSETYINNIKNGNRELQKIETVQRLAHALDVSIDTLLMDSLNACKMSFDDGTGNKDLINKIYNQLTIMDKENLRFLLIATKHLGHKKEQQH